MRQTILCATTNEHKFGIGKTVLIKHGIDLVQHPLDITEIQGEDFEVIIRDKVAKAFSQLNEPVIVTDDSWSIAALQGFPGPYMKSINHWFKPDDFIALMQGKTDRRITLHQCVAYCDGKQTVVFTSDILGTVTAAPRGNYGPPIMKVTELTDDNGLTISEVYDQGSETLHVRLADRGGAWTKLGQWLEKQQ